MKNVIQWLLLVPASFTAGFLATIMLDFSLSVSLNFAMIDVQHILSQTVIKGISYIFGGIVIIYCAYIMAPAFRFKVAKYCSFGVGIAALVVIISAIQLSSYWPLYYAVALLTGAGGTTAYLYNVFNKDGSDGTSR